MATLQKRGVLGAGSFGDVSLSWWEGGHTDVAVKANGVNCANTSAIDNERTLLELLLRHPHKNILVVYGIVTDAPDGSVRLVMAYCAGGSLDSHLSRMRESGEVWLYIDALLASTLCAWNALIMSPCLAVVCRCCH